MRIQKTNSLMKKLIGLLLLTSVTSMAIVGYYAFVSGRSALEQSIFEKLSSAVEMRKASITRYLGRTMQEVSYLAHTPSAVLAVEKLRGNPGQTGPTLGKKSERDVHDYAKAFAETAEFFQGYLDHYGTENHGYDDILIVNAASGDVVFSAKKRKDLGSNLLRGPYKDTALGRLFLRVSQTGKPAMMDYSIYAPADIPLAFLGSPIKDSDGVILGVLALAIDSQAINTIMRPTQDMGRHTSIYLVGPDFTMRSQSHSETVPSVLRKKIEFRSVTAALRGESGTEVTPDEKGELSLISFANVGLNKIRSLGADFDWALIADADVKDVLAPISNLSLNVIWILVLITLITVVVAYFLSRSIAKPMMEGINILASASSEISATVSQLASSSSQTFAAISETTATLEELRQSGQLSSNKAKSVSEESRNSIQIAQTGKKATEEIIAGMNQIKSQMESIGDTVIRLSEQSRSIEEIIDAVKDLADQSNLLAVNASIEAARAGEQGKGFSVVAEEIKSLSDQSKRATDQVRTILDDIRNSISGVVMATERGSKAVEAGVQQSAQTSHAIHAVSSSVQDASQALTVIVASTEQQAVGVDQVASAMDSIDQAMRQNVEGTKQLETAAKNLEELGHRLKDVIEGRRKWLRREHKQ